jgi:hypothetical protein
MLPPLRLLQISQPLVLLAKDKLAINVSSSTRWNPPSPAQRRVYAAAVVSHRVSLGLELASDVAMSAEPVALHSLKWEAIST